MSYQDLVIAKAVKAGVVDAGSRGAVWDNTEHTQGLKFTNDGKVILKAVSTIAPTHSYATWSTTQKQAGDYAALLTKLGTDADRSTHLQFTPAVGLTLTAFLAAIDGAGALDPEYSFYHYDEAVAGNFAQMEFRFEDPNSDAWLEITALPLQGITGGAAWAKATLTGAMSAGFGGNTPDGSSVFEWAPPPLISGLSAAITAAWTAAETGEVATGYLLERVRFELWETAARTCYIDTVVINDVAYAIEPGSIEGIQLGNGAGGGNTPGVTLNFIEIRDKYGRTETLAPIVGAEQELIAGPLLPELFNDGEGYTKFKPDTTGLTVRYSAIKASNPS